MLKVSQPPSPSRAMQWAGLIIAAFLTALPIIIACVIKNPYYLAPSLPLGFIWRSLAKFLYKRPEDYRLDEIKIKCRANNLNRKKQMP